MSSLNTAVRAWSTTCLKITIIHADNGAPRITGTTDTTNSPMAAAFHRAGYDLTTSRVVIEPVQA